MLASGNRHKLAEFRRILTPHEVLAMPDGVRLPPEGSASFEQNARGKAEALADALQAGAVPAPACGLPDLVFGDDSGLEVEALGWAPGVRSSRYAGEEADDADNNRLLLFELSAAVGADDPTLRRARFVCVLAALAPVSRGLTVPPLSVRGEWWGSIASRSRGDGGFGYDPLFVPDGDERTVAELSAAEKGRRSHRALAGAELMRRLPRGV